MRRTEPFDTEERDEQRREQREQLRLIEYWVIQDVLQTVAVAPDLPEEHDRPLVEMALRDAAETLTSEIDALGSDVLPRMAAATYGTPIARFISTAQLNGPVPGASILQNALDAAHDDENQHISGIHRPEGLSALLYDLVAALIWADHVAGDYTDPRLTTWLRATPDGK